MKDLFDLRRDFALKTFAEQEATADLWHCLNYG